MSDGMAPGQPGIEARWTSSAKEGVGTAISAISQVWFTLSHGILNEIYFPRMDIANTRDVQFLVTSEDGGFWEEKRDLISCVQYIHADAPAFLLTSRDPDNRFRLTKRVISWTGGHSVILYTHFQVLKGHPSDYHVYLLVAPHIGNQGGANFAERITLKGRPVLMAWRQSTYLTVAATTPFAATSVGFVGNSDGWTQLSRHRRLIPYDQAYDGNVAMTAELDFRSQSESMVVLSFGRSRSESLLTAELTLLHNYADMEDHYIQEWSDYLRSLPHLLSAQSPHSHLQHVSAMVLKTHHGKLFPGGIIASLSIPWGQAAGDGNIGGYHLVWPRDLVEAAFAFVALGDIESARQSLFYLAATQQDNGSWSQNFWLDGQPYWPGSQLDETAFPIHLAYRLWQAGALKPDEDVYPMVKKGMAFIVQSGPVTQQERWEEDGGYSPATLAVCISALIIGADMARAHRDHAVADYAEAVADYWQANLDRWTFTDQGQVDPRFRRHYVRIHSETAESPDGNIHHGWIPIKNVVPGEPSLYPEVAVIDGGFLELVRHGIKSADDPNIQDSVAAYDGILRKDLPYGPLYYRYNHDGYGEAADGSPYQGAGIGRLWPLLSGERGHYAISSGENPEPYVMAMEQAASRGGLIPEQVWDGPDIPERELAFGRPSGSAMPLVWAHAEYIKLLHSIAIGRPFETERLVANRYASGNPQQTDRLFWSFNHKRRHWRAAENTLRISAQARARLVFTTDGWQQVQTADLKDSGLGTYYHDIDVRGLSKVEFTFYWIDAEHWEGKNFCLEQQYESTVM